MISSEVQRTLVKSPPELWAELSDPAALARHLGELGEIRITRIDPEQAVEWEAQDTSGTVLIKPSGWGTKVTLTVIREIPQPEPPVAPESPAGATPAAEAEPAPTAETEPRFAMEERSEFAVEDWPEFASEPEPELAAEADPEPDVELETEYPPEVEASAAEAFEPEPELEPRRSFFSRLFRRPLREQAVDPEVNKALATGESPPEPDEAIETGEALREPPETITTWEQVAEPPEAIATVESLHEPAAVETAEATGSAGAEPADISAELRAAEEVAAEEVAAVLTAVLDRLGAAHHRPFSRG